MARAGSPVHPDREPTPPPCPPAGRPRRARSVRPVTPLPHRGFQTTRDPHGAGRSAARPARLGRRTAMPPRKPGTRKAPLYRRREDRATTQMGFKTLSLPCFQGAVLPWCVGTKVPREQGARTPLVPVTPRDQAGAGTQFMEAPSPRRYQVGAGARSSQVPSSCSGQADLVVRGSGSPGTKAPWNLETMAPVRRRPQGPNMPRPPWSIGTLARRDIDARGTLGPGQTGTSVGRSLGGFKVKAPWCRSGEGTKRPRRAGDPVSLVTGDQGTGFPRNRGTRAPQASWFPCGVVGLAHQRPGRLGTCRHCGIGKIGPRGTKLARSQATRADWQLDTLPASYRRTRRPIRLGLKGP